MDACQPPDDLHPRCEDAFAKVGMYAVQPPERAARRAAPQARFGRLYGVSAAMNAVFEMIEKVAPSDARARVAPAPLWPLTAARFPPI